jgi:polysaccharide biosynthesis protein PelE
MAKPARDEQRPLNDGGSAIWSHAVRFALMVLAAEILLLAVAAVAGLDYRIWVVGHVAILAGAIYGWQCNPGPAGDASAHMLVIFGTMVTGPLGAALALVALFQLRRERPAAHVLEAWYDRIALAGDVDDVTQLCDNVAMGRTVDISAPVPRVFEQVIAEGSLEDRQAALGLIARRFHPCYTPALRAALVSPEPVIRVQAAAVAVKVKADLERQLKASLGKSKAESASVGEKAMLARDLQEMAACGLLDDKDRDRAQAAADAILEAVLATGASVPEVMTSLRGRYGMGSVVETELLRQGRYEEFRALRASAKAHAAAPVARQAGEAIHG